MTDERSDLLRWYDAYPNIRDVITLSEALPVSVQEEIGNHFIAMVKQYQRALEGAVEFKHLGPEVVLSLYKSKCKQRWYDEVSALHIAVNLMMSLPPAVMQHMDQQYHHYATALRTQHNKMLRRSANPTLTLDNLNSTLYKLNEIELAKAKRNLRAKK
jgi:hypothetical protein